ncbi:MAG: peptidylprolyl isomerase [Sulfuricurvum sp.]|jgi:FKBP-type peptidyl-prolyl cis-trans isomerase SlyD|uniref:FKBP-type peptidyl-prolyl cis-trans isomerase n=1 Tax=Sulfuricurvum sp. TaxID=2025608 RepID=UPI0025D7EA4B|nr:peptidylprolyl isomerase [Sulfuricurvum sp.]MCK9372629.1 peptidylprolyl isomerase [Sulfuricurvum sp.]
MTITKNIVVTLDYQVYNSQGDLIDPGESPLVYLHGGYDNLFIPVEQELEGKNIGDTLRVAMSAEEAFGPYREELVVTESLSDLPDDLEIGMEIEGYLESAEDDVIIYRVVQIDTDTAIMDANHPLAGKDIVFEATVTAIRAASKKEIAAKHFIPLWSAS